MTEPINVANMCPIHQSLLVHQAGYGPDDTWRALIISAQIALFQAVTTDPKIYARVDGQIERLAELGCMACLRPDSFGEIVEAAKSHDISDIKALGERWVKQASEKKETI